MAEPATDELIAHLEWQIKHDKSLGLQLEQNEYYAALIARIRVQDAKLKQVEPLERGYIEIEKRLCTMLGKQWTVTGLSCDTLLTEVAATIERMDEALKEARKAVPIAIMAERAAAARAARKEPT